VRRETARGAADKGHAAECAAFVAAIQGRGPAPMPYASIVATMEATFTAQESLIAGPAGAGVDAPA